MTKTTIAMLAALGVIAGCATVAADADYRKVALDMMKADFKTKGPATTERVFNQDEVERLCSDPSQAVAPDAAARLQASQLASVVYPADGKYLGDWKAGEAVAQNGRGLQSSDKVGAVNGGNCYACHQITKAEISYGNIGPSLYNYGVLRGQSDAIVRYTWGKLYNAQAYNACSNMPRFGHNGILTQTQLKDVMALLLDPASPVNK
jgi:sulfur-oxidizing protein SoxX